MFDVTATTTTLLAGLLDQNNEAVWRLFSDRYRPILLALAGRMGLNAEDAADVTQQTLAEFVRDYRAGKYQRERGRLSQWILGIARHRICDLKRAPARQPLRGDSALADLADPHRLTDIWEAEHRHYLVAQAMMLLREQTRSSPTTLLAFELLVVEELPAADVAQRCGLQVAEVYRIKHRLTDRLRELLKDLESAYEDTR